MPASVNIKVNSDFAQASKDLQKFGQVTAAEEKRIKAFTESFKSEQVDAFIDKNRRAGAVVKAHGDEIKGLETQQRNLERQMQSLISKGLDPEDEAVKKLEAEYQRLEKEVQNNTQAQRGLEMATKAAEAGLVAIAATVAAVAVAAVKSTIELGKMGDELAKTSRKVGVNVETFQELSFAAERVGMPASSLSGIFEKLNRNVGDLQANTGTLTTYLNKSNPALAEQLKSVTDTEEAFNILIDEIAKAPTQFEKAALSQAAFGRSGQSLILFANEGTESINALRQEARNYGLVSEQVAAKSEAFADAQRNMQQATIGARAEFAENLLPVFTDILNGAASFISEGYKLQLIFEGVAQIIPVVTAGLVAYLAIVKGAEIVRNMTAAIKAMNLAMAANPIGAVVLALTAVTTAIIAFNKVLDAKRVEEFNKEFGETEEIAALTTQQFTDLAKNSDAIEQGFVRMQNSIGGISADKLEGEVTRISESFGISESTLVEILKSSDKLNDSFKEQLDNIDRNITAREEELAIIDLQNVTIAEAIQYSNQNLANREAARAQAEAELEAVRAQRALEEQNTLQKQIEARTKAQEEYNKAIAEAETRRRLGLITEEEVTQIGIESARKYADALIQAGYDGSNALELGNQALLEMIGLLDQVEEKQPEETLSERLNELALTEEQEFNQRIITYERFLEERANLQGVYGEARIEYLKEELARILELETLSVEERAELEEKLNEKIKEEQEKKTETFKITMDDILSVVRAGANEIFNIWDESIQNTLNSQLSAINAQEQATLRAKGLIEKSAKEQAQEQLAIAKRTGDAEKALEAQKALDKIAIEEEFQKKRVQAQYEADLEAYNLAVTQSIVNGAMAVLSPLAEGDYVGAIVAGALAAVQIAVVAANKPKKPSFQTGTGSVPFTVPDSNVSTADSRSINVGPGEEATITPRGESGRSQNIIVQIDERVIFDIVNDGIQSQDIRITADNIQGGAAAS